MTQQNLFNLATPTMETFDASRCYSKPINYQTAKRMVVDYHYAHRAPSIVAAIGMYVDEVLAGVITYGIPPTPNTQRFCGEEYRKNVLELNRLFVFDWAGRNSESWLIGQSFRWLQKNHSNYFALISYADWGEHHMGYIYQATNWIYTGTSTPGKDLTLPDNKHSRTTTHLGGYAEVRKIEGAKMVARTTKHRYIYFLGSKGQKKKLRKLLKWPVLPYPKGDN